MIYAHLSTLDNPLGQTFLMMWFTDVTSLIFSISEIITFVLVAWKTPYKNCQMLKNFF